MSDMWRTREPPVPLDFDKIAEGSFALPFHPEATASTNADSGPSTSLKPPHSNGHEAKPSNGSTGTPNSSEGVGLKDQRELSLQDNLELFISRYVYDLC